MKAPYIGRPNQAHAPAYTKIYFALTEGDNLHSELKKSLVESLLLLESIPEEKGDYAYAEGKWTIKGVLSHVVDTERIFQYRALRLSRHDSTPIAGFEQDDYDAHSNLENRSLKSIIEEFKLVREHSLSLLLTMSDNQLDFVGEAGGSPLSARSAFWLMVGHPKHHEKILKERYL